MNFTVIEVCGGGEEGSVLFFLALAIYSICVCVCGGGGGRGAVTFKNDYFFIFILFCWGGLSKLSFFFCVCVVGAGVKMCSIVRIGLEHSVELIVVFI